jgi:hypothetical protein
MNNTKIKKPKIKPSVDTEISMWNSGYKVGKEEAQVELIRTFGKIIEYGIDRQEGLRKNNPILSDFTDQEVENIKNKWEELKKQIEK